MGRHRKTEESPGSSSVSSESVDKAPDGGWGWAVCFGSFLVNFILDGTMFSFGVLLLELLNYFGEGKSKTAWIGSSLLGMSMFMGPIVSILLERYTCRQITIAGTLVSVVAFVVSTFSTNVEMLIITYGIIGGIGFSMSFISAIIVVGLYFNQKRSIATGIAMSGSGLGTFAYAYLTDFLIGQYNWRGTILILSGILLNGVVCGALFRPLGDKFDQSSSSESISNAQDVNDVTELKKLLSSKKFNALNTQFDSRYLDTSTMPARLTMSTDLVRVQRDLLVADTCNVREFSSQSDCRDIQRRTMKNPMAKRDVFYSGSLTHLHGHHNSRLLSSHQHIDCEDPETKALKQTHQCSPTGLVEIVKSNCALFKDRIFVLLLLTNVCWTGDDVLEIGQRAVQSVPLTYIPDLGVSKSLPTSQAAMLISIVGVTNIIGRILSGMITDLFRIKSTMLYIVALFSASAVNFVFPWCEGFVPLAVCSAAFGLCMATAVSMRTIVLADHLGMDRLTKSFGTVALFQGIAFMTNAPLGGFLYETFNSYVMPFSFAGVMYFLSGVFCLAVQCLDHGDDEEIIIHVECSKESDT